MNEKETLRYSVQEKEINLMDLLWKLVYSWRAIIIWSVVFACLLTAVKYMKDSKNQEVDQKTLTENIRSGLTEDENVTLEQAIVENKAIEKQLMNNTEYQKKSILMNIDPYNENQVILQYYVNAHYSVNLSESFTKDYTPTLIKAYETYLANLNFTEDFVRTLDVDDSRYLSELIRINLDIMQNSGSGFDSSNLSVDTFRVSVTGKDMDQARILTDFIKQAVGTYQSELSEKIGVHDLILIDSHEQVIQDSELAEKQAKVETTNYNLRVQQDSLKSKLSAQQLQVLEQERNGELAVEDDTVDLQKKAGINKKYTILGFLVGAFFACVLIALKYIMDSHIKSEKEIQEFYGLRIFGVLDQQQPSKKMFSFVDRWLDRIRGQQRGNLQEQLEITITNLRMTCKKADMNKVFFTTSIRLNENEKRSVDQIMGQLNQQGIETIFEENIMRNSNALVKMSEIGTVVLIEKSKQTEYQALEQEINLCQDQSAKLLGVIAMNE